MHIEVDTTAERKDVVTCIAHLIHERDLYRIEFLLCVDRQFLAVTTNDIEVIERLEDVLPSRICTTDCGLHVIDDRALRVIHGEAELVFRERAIFFLELRDIRILSLVCFGTHLEHAHEEIDEPVLAFFVVFVQEESFDDDAELIRDDTDAVIVDLDHAGHLLTECRRSIVGRLVIHRTCRIDIDRTRDEPGIPDYFYEAVILAREMDNAFIAIFIQTCFDACDSFQMSWNPEAAFFEGADDLDSEMEVVLGELRVITDELVCARDKFFFRHKEELTRLQRTHCRILLHQTTLVFDIEGLAVTICYGVKDLEVVVLDLKDTHTEIAVDEIGSDHRSMTRTIIAIEHHAVQHARLAILDRCFQHRGVLFETVRIDFARESRDVIVLDFPEVRAANLCLISDITIERILHDVDHHVVETATDVLVAGIVHLDGADDRLEELSTGMRLEPTLAIILIEMSDIEDVDSVVLEFFRLLVTDGENVLYGVRVSDIVIRLIRAIEADTDTIITFESTKMFFVAFVLVQHHQDFFLNNEILLLRVIRVDLRDASSWRLWSRHKLRPSRSVVCTARDIP